MAQTFHEVIRLEHKDAGAGYALVQTDREVIVLSIDGNPLILDRSEARKLAHALLNAADVTVMGGCGVTPIEATRRAADIIEAARKHPNTTAGDLYILAMLALLIELQVRS